MKKHLPFISKLTFFIVGIGASIWFLIRVIPKPSRATYPCMRVAAPIMSSLVIYLLTLSGSILAFRKAGKLFSKTKYIATAFSLVLAISLSILFFTNDSLSVFASSKLAELEAPNSPIGNAKGIFPGRVVWVMDKNATDETCTNTDGDYWFQEGNTNYPQVEKMLSDGILAISGKSTLVDGWDVIFKYFNNNHNKGEVGYKAGEKIVIKINLTTMGAGGRNMNEQMDATPQLVYALLKELIDVVKVAQTDITLGDPFRGMPNEIYNLCHNSYPNVNYIEGMGGSGRIRTKITTSDVYFNSDDQFQSRLPQAYVDAAYLINLPCLKSHDAAGITIAAKNHQGSVIGPDQDAASQYMGPYLHYDYPLSGVTEMGSYRHIVDYMAHKYLGGNTLIYIVDAIWCGNNWSAAVEKWQMPPFNNDWPSSLFISQDAVAIESVGFDFLYNEYKDYSESHGYADYPCADGVQDYIHQAADPSARPNNISYDPSTETHSNPVGSLGVHEHWNNVTDKKYSRNLGTGQGIELYTIGVQTSVKNNKFEKNTTLNISPNPAFDQTNLTYNLIADANVKFQLISTDGKMVASTATIKQSAGPNTYTLNTSKYNLKGGTYVCKVVVNGYPAYTSNLVIAK